MIADERNNTSEGSAFTAFLTNFPHNYDTPEKRKAKAQEIANNARISCRFWERGDMIIVNPESVPMPSNDFPLPYDHDDLRDDHEYEGGWTKI